MRHFRDTSPHPTAPRCPCRNQLAPAPCPTLSLPPGPPVPRQPALLPDTTPARVSEMMLAGDELGLCEMGANQVVIVRSASAKKKLPPLLQSGLVLTVEARPAPLPT